MLTIAHSFLKKYVSGLANLSLTAGLSYFWYRALFILLYFWVTCFTLSAQPKFTNPIRFTSKDGLPDNRLTCIEQDNDGFLWIGTVDGLCRFDGSVTKVFRNDPKDSTTISHNYIRSIFFDEDRHALWIGTLGELNVLDLHTLTFKRFPHRAADPRTLPENNIVTTILKDRQGALWVGLEKQGLLRYNPTEDNFTPFHYRLNGTEIGSRLNRINYIIQIKQDLIHDEILWITTGSGLLRFDKEKESFIRYYHTFDNERFDIGFNSSAALYPLPDGRLLLGSWSGFLGLFDPSSKDFKAFSATLDTLRFPRGTGVAFSIVKKSESEVWVATRQGMLVFDHKQDRITSERLNEPENDRFFLPSLKDRDQRIWGRSSKGLFGFDPLHEQFEHFPLEEKAAARSLHIDDILPGPENHLLYVSIPEGRGLYRLNKRTGQWIIIPPPPSFFNQKQGFDSRALLYLQDGRLLVVEESTLFTLSNDGRQLIPFFLQPKAQNPKFMNAVQDSLGRIWLTSVNAGLFRLDTENGTIKSFQDELLEEDQKGQGLTVGNILLDRFGNLWVAINQGFCVYLSERDTFLNFRYQPGRTNTFNHVSAFMEDRTGNLLIAGGQFGIGMADPQHPEKGIVERLRLKDDSSLMPHRLIEDSNGDLWFYDDKNLNRINLQTRLLDSYDGHDGLISKVDEPTTLQLNGIESLPSGEIAILYRNGKGLGLFHPDSLRRNRELPRPYLTSFAVFDEEWPGDTALLQLNEIILPYAQNFFSFTFSAIGFTQAHQITFKYQLEGVDEDWIFPQDNRRYANYSQVWEGNYTLKIMAANNEGAWNPKPYTLSIRVLPPWYRSGWAYFLYALALVTLVFSVYRLLKYRWALKIEAEMEHAEALRMKELDAAKTRLYTNITHEFRTPLTLILGMAEQIRENPERWYREGLSIISRNGKNLLRLVNQMLALNKLESGILPVHMVQSDIVAYLHYLLESFHSMAESKQIELLFRSNLPQLYMDFDPDKLAVIVSNLISNAIKFTPAEGKVELVVDATNMETDSSPKDSLLLTISDTGIGIPAEQIAHVFDRFYQVEGSKAAKQEGTGIGLALTKELVKLLGGSIELYSKKGKGTSFRLKLPITRSAATKEVIGSELAMGIAPGEIEIPKEISHPIAALPKEKKRPLLLLVEDNQDLIHFLQTCLQPAYRLAIAHDGREGIEKAYKFVPDLIVSDVMMPEMDGFELCQQLKQDTRTSHIPIMLLTARADQDSRLQGLEHGADAYLSKPFQKAELLLRIRKLLELRRQLQQHYLALAGVKEEWLIEFPSLAGLEQEFLGRVRSLLEAHLTDPEYSVEQLCRDLGMSKSHLHRKLTALTGMSANRFLRSVRLVKAQTLLANSGLTISEVAYQTGFRDPDYFARTFRKAFGLSPREYQRSRSASK